MNPKQRPIMLSSEESAALRARYLDAFIDTQSTYYQDHIAKLQKFSDGARYTGYLWDCLRKPERLSVGRLRKLVNELPRVLVMADNHSHDRVIGAPLWPYAANSIVEFSSQVLLQALMVLPEDLYIFDSSMSWTLVLTHEHDEHERICCSIGKIGA